MYNYSNSKDKINSCERKVEKEFLKKSKLKNFKILYALRKGRNIVRSFVKTPMFLHPLTLPVGGVMMTSFWRLPFGIGSARRVWLFWVDELEESSSPFQGRCTVPDVSIFFSNSQQESIFPKMVNSFFKQIIWKNYDADVISIRPWSLILVER